MGKKWNTTSSAVAAAAVWNACGNNSDASGLDLMCPDDLVHTSIFFVVSLSILLLAGISLSTLFDEERILDKSLLCSGLGEDRGWLLAPNHAHTTFNERLSHEIEDAFVSARCYALSRGCSCEARALWLHLRLSLDIPLLPSRPLASPRVVSHVAQSIGAKVLWILPTPRPSPIAPTRDVRCSG